MGKELTEADRSLAADMLARARAAMAAIEDWSQADLNRLSQAIAWYAGNETTFTRLAQRGVDESGIGDRAGRAGQAVQDSHACCATRCARRKSVGRRSRKTRKRA